MSGGRTRPMSVDHRVDGPRLWLPEGVVLKTARLLRSYCGPEEHEGVVYWGGMETPGGPVVLTAMSPTAATTWGSFRTDSDANAKLVLTLARLDLVLVAQVHSHPGDWVDHSDGDDSGALVRFQGFWSLVVPHFARGGMQHLSNLGIHLYDAGEFRRLSNEAAAARVRILPAAVDLREDR